MNDDLKRSVACCRTMFQAFADEYEKAVLTNRQTAWAEAVRATVVMLEHVETPRNPASPWPFPEFKPPNEGR